MKGASRWDPVGVLNLPGTLLGLLDCPYMIAPRRGTKLVACGAQATLYRFPDPYGLRSYCEEDHVCVLSQHSTAALVVPHRKGRTD
jgi:hypothetical protein